VLFRSVFPFFSISIFERVELVPHNTSPSMSASPKPSWFGLRLTRFDRFD